MRLILAVLLALLPAAALAQSERRLVSADAARALDAAQYARAFAVPQDEADRRLRAQDELGPVVEQLAIEFGDRLAGFTLEHRPTFRLRIALTGADSVPPRFLPLGGTTLPVLFVVNASATRAATVAAIERRQAALRAALPHPPALAADPLSGALLVFLNDSDARLLGAPLDARLTALAGVPARALVLGNAAVNASALAGGRITGIGPGDSARHLCTAGFAVTDGRRDALATAAHCPDEVVMEDGPVPEPLPFISQDGWSFRDVQLNAAPTPLTPVFVSDRDKLVLRPVAAVRPRAQVIAGDWVCHRGERSGYSCALVRFTDFAPAGDLCGGPCAPRWAMVAGPGCRNGDSGGPVFVGSTALGLLKGASFAGDGSCRFYMYMPLDFLPVGWRVKLASPELVQGQQLDVDRAAGGTALGEELR